ncbi:MAG: ribonuclease R [Gammaproteobacteria bacterium]
MKSNTDKTKQYKVSIPSREDILELLKQQGQPCTLKEIAAELDAGTSEHRAALRKRLQAMVRDGQIIKNRRSGYGLVRQMDLIPGRVIGHADGFGFLVPDRGGDDIFLPPKVMRSLMNGDRAVVRIDGKSRRGKPEGALVEVLERANKQVVGRYSEENGIGFVTPDNRRLHLDVYVEAKNRGEAQKGQYVLAEIIKYPDKHTQPVGRITEIIGERAEAGLATEIAMRAYELPHEWPKPVLKEIKGFRPDSPVDSEGRKDLRSLPFVTIDGEDARDFDDAVYCEKRGKDWYLMVAIADVSHYVRPGTALDEEAKTRGTSVYFPDRVIPMLPEVLSNELCSLKPEVDRLAMVCEMRLDGQGKIKQYRFFDAVIRSAARLTYTDMAALVVDRDKEARDRREAIVPHVDDLYSLFDVRHKYRARHGLLDFDTTEVQLFFDDKGGIADIRPVIRNDAHRLIEEFMLAANVSTAEYLLENEVPILFRNHEQPKEEKLSDVREFLGELGLSLGGGDEPTAVDYYKLIESIRERPDKHLIETVLLRSLPLAVYSEENLGHFGLAFDAYTHFTSPIRRYPDLLVHRTIRDLIKGRKKSQYDKETMHDLGVHCSVTERRADEATREVVQRLKCDYIKNRVGEEFAGTITGVTGFGLFVELDDFYVEGLVHVTSLPGDYYHHDPIHHRLTGERSGRVFRLAEKVRVRVMRVDVDDKKIDFELCS